MRLVTLGATLRGLATFTSLCQADRVRGALQRFTRPLADTANYIGTTGKSTAEGLAEGCEEGGHCSTLAGEFCETSPKFEGVPCVPQFVLQRSPSNAGKSARLF